MSATPSSRVILLALATVLLLGGLFALQSHFAAVPLEGLTRVHTVLIDERGHEFFNATLTLENATALTALDNASKRGDFTYHVKYYAGFGGGGAGAYVDEINGTRAEPGQPDGWIYRVHRDDAWIVPDRSAAIYALRDGDGLAWAWSAAWDGD